MKFGLVALVVVGLAYGVGVSGALSPLVEAGLQWAVAHGAGFLAAALV